MLKRRQLIKLSGSVALLSLQPEAIKSAVRGGHGNFRYCLNTSTISGQKPGLLNSIDIAAKAGYDGVELWINDIQQYVREGHSIADLNAFIKARKLTVYNIISFTHWMVDDSSKRQAALEELAKEMTLAAALDCHRIAAPPSGVEKGTVLDAATIGYRYKMILELGRKHHVIPVLEFWGASGTLYNISQAMAIAAAADDPDAKILPDVYHMFRGGSGFNALQLLNGRAVEIIHINDYPADKPVAEQTDADRVYPGDGAAPLKQILKDLKSMGGIKALSLELFNRSYWQQDALEVAKTGLNKVKKLVMEIDKS